MNEYEPQYEDRYLIGCPVSRHKQRKLGIAQYDPPLGSRKLPCCACRKGVFISREQYQVYEDSIDDGSIKVKCFNCARVDLAKSDIVLWMRDRERISTWMEPHPGRAQAIINAP